MSGLPGDETAPPPRPEIPESAHDLLQQLLGLARERLAATGSVDERIWRSIDATLDLVQGPNGERLPSTRTWP